MATIFETLQRRLSGVSDVIAPARRVVARPRFEPTAFLLALLLFFGFIFRTHLGGTRQWALGDYVPWSLTLGGSWDWFYYAWNESGLGNLNPLLPGVWATRTFLGPIFFSTDLAQRVFLLAQLPVAAFGMYVLLRYLVATPWVRMLVAFLYVANGFTITLLQIGAIPTLIVHTGFPWFMLFTLHFLRDERNRWAPLVGAMAVLAFVSLWQPFAVVRLPPFFAAFMLLEFARRRSWTYTWRTTLMVAGAVALLFFLIIPYALDQLRSVLALATVEGAREQGVGLYFKQPIDVRLENARLVYTVFPETVRSFESLTILGLLLLPLLARAKGLRAADMVTVMAVATAFLIWGRLLSAGYTHKVFELAPPTLVFINPDRIGEIALEGYMVALGVGLDALWRSAGGLRRWWRRGAGAALVVAASLVALFVVISDAHPPHADRVFNTRLFFSQGLALGRGTFGEVPPLFEEAGAWLDEREAEEGKFRTLWLPSHRNVQVQILPVYARGGFRGFYDLGMLVLDPFVKGENDAFPETISEFGVKYVVINAPDWPDPGHREMYGEDGLEPRAVPRNDNGQVELRGAPADYQQLVEQYPAFQPVAEGKGWRIYENAAFQQMNRAYGRVYLMQPAWTPADALTSASTANLIANPEFEQDAAGWEVHLASEMESQVLPGAGPAGEAALQVSGARWVGARGLFGGPSQVVDVTEGGLYVSTWMRATGVRQTRLRARFYASRDAAEQYREDEIILTLDGQPQAVTTYKLTEDWTFLEWQIRVPPDAKAAWLIFEARPGGTEPATTWYANPAVAEFVTLPIGGREEIVGSPGDALSRAPLLDEARGIVSRVPFLNDPAHLLLLDDFANSEQTRAEWRGLADVLVTMGDPVRPLDEELARIPRMIQVQEAEEVLAVSSGAGFVEDERFSQGEGMNFEAASLQLTPPRADRYWILLGGAAAGVTVTRGGETSAVERIRHAALTSTIGWWATQPLELGAERQVLDLRAPEGHNATVDQIVLVSAGKGETLLDAIGPAAPSVASWTRNNPSSYSVHVDSATPVVLTLAQNFHADWQAVDEDGDVLEHFPVGLLGWENGFLVGPGEHDIEVAFTRQRERSFIIALWFLAWGAVAVALIGFGTARLATAERRGQVATWVRTPTVNTPWVTFRGRWLPVALGGSIIVALFVVILGTRQLHSNLESAVDVPLEKTALPRLADQAATPATTPPPAAPATLEPTTSAPAPAPTPTPTSAAALPLSAGPCGGWSTEANGTNSATCTNPDPDDGPGGTVIRVNVQGHSGSASARRSFEYDGRSAVRLQATVTVNERAPLSAATIHVRGYDATGAERLRVLYYLYENVDRSTSTPQENGQGVYILKTRVGGPDIGVPTEIDRAVSDDFVRVFPGVWRSLGLVQLRVELAGWADGAIEAEYRRVALDTEGEPVPAQVEDQETPAKPAATPTAGAPTPTAADTEPAEVTPVPLEDIFLGQRARIEEGTTNLVTNPSLETNTTGWAVLGANTIARSTVQAKFGSASLACTWQSGGGSNAARFDITLTAAEHTYSAWLYIPASYDGGGVQINQAAFAGATGETSVSADMSLRDQWQRLDLTFTPDAADLTGRIELTHTGANPTVGEVIYLDGVQVELKGHVTTYADGSLGDGYAWTGVSHASTSSRARGPSLLPTGVLSGTAGTLAVWVRLDYDNTVAVDRRFFGWKADEDHYLSGYFAAEDASFRMVARNGDALDAAIIAAGEFDAGEEMLLVFAWDAERIYVTRGGGASATVVRTGGPLDLAATRSFDIGALDGVEQINGLVGPVYLFDRVLTPSEVGFIYASR